MLTSCSTEKVVGHLNRLPWEVATAPACQSSGSIWLTLKGCAFLLGQSCEVQAVGLGDLYEYESLPAIFWVYDTCKLPITNAYETNSLLCCRGSREPARNEMWLEPWKLVWYWPATERGLKQYLLFCIRNSCFENRVGETVSTPAEGRQDEAAERYLCIFPFFTHASETSLHQYFRVSFV